MIRLALLLAAAAAAVANTPSMVLPLKRHEHKVCEISGANHASIFIFAHAQHLKISTRRLFAEEAPIYGNFRELACVAARQLSAKPHHYTLVQVLLLRCVGWYTPK